MSLFPKPGFPPFFLFNPHFIRFVCCSLNVDLNRDASKTKGEMIVVTAVLSSELFYALVWVWSFLKSSFVFPHAASISSSRFFAYSKQNVNRGFRCWWRQPRGVAKVSGIRVTREQSGACLSPIAANHHGYDTNGGPEGTVSVPYRFILSPGF